MIMKVGRKPDHKRLTVLNVKGGSGKSTLCTNIAAQLVQREHKVALEDYDPLTISYQWAVKRPDNLPSVFPINASVNNPKRMTRAFMRRVPKPVDLVICDTPGAFDRLQLQDFIQDTHAVIIPVSDSSIDIETATEFIPKLLQHHMLKDKKHIIGIVANRTSQQKGLRPGFGEFLESLPVDWIASISDNPAYIDAYGEGKGICELQHRRYLDRIAWARIVGWIEKRLGSDD